MVQEQKVRDKDNVSGWRGYSTHPSNTVQTQHNSLTYGWSYLFTGFDFEHQILLHLCWLAACLTPFKATLIMCSAAETTASSSIRFYVSAPQAEAESLTQRDDGALLTDASAGQLSRLPQSVVPDVPVITGVEESRGAAGDQEDKEELEFPHDLLPSLDFSSELNIWESSLG